jgi:hypothetical protein
MEKAEFEKARAELPILRSFIDFVNKQVGVYSDALSSFEGNKVRIERQVARVQRPVGKQIKDGRPVVMWASFEDPSSPDAIHHRIIRADDFIKANSEAGFNEQQVCWSIIVFMFAYWDEEIRPQIAKVRGVAPNEVMIDEFGDLRIFRKNIIHNGGILPAADHAKLKVMQSLASPDATITFSHDQMHKLFVHIKQGIAKLVLKYTGHLPGAPDASDIVSIAIQNS